MSQQLDSQRLGQVFGSRPDILQGIQRTAGKLEFFIYVVIVVTFDADLILPDSPSRIALFNEIATYFYDQLQGNEGPAIKKRKVDSGANGTSSTGSNPADETVLLEVKEISVSVPQRKKFELCFTAGHIYARTPGTIAPIPAITYAWKDIG